MAVARVQFVEPDVIMDIAAAVPTATSSRIVDVGVVPGVNPCTLCAAVSRASLMFSNWRAEFLPGTGRSQPNNSRTYIKTWIKGVNECMREGGEEGG